MVTKRSRIAVAAVFGLSLLVAAQVSGASDSVEKVKELANELGLELGGQARLRAEFDARDMDSGTNSDEAVSSRMRLSLGAEPIEDVRGFVQIQDVRVWGGYNLPGHDSSTEDEFELSQGFIVIDDIFGSGIQVQGGRQEVNFGEQRLIGALDWSQRPRSFDGILLKKEFDGVGWIQPFWFALDEEDYVTSTGNLLSDYDRGATEDSWLAGFHSVWEPCDFAVVEPHYYFLKDERNVFKQDRHTFGVYVHGASEIDSDLTALYDVTFDYQAGEEGPESNDEDIKAFMVVAHLGLKIQGILIRGGYEYLSGDDDPYDGDAEAFDTLFPTGHKFHGHMDYFLDFGHLGDDVLGLGLQDIVANVRVPLGENTKAALDYHWFLTAEEDPAVATSRMGGSQNLGQEVDLWLKHKYNEYLNFVVGYSLFVPGGGMRHKPPFGDGMGNDGPGSVGHWAYVMTDLQF